ncbi:Glycosyltransferase, GT2 family [Fibrobacter sp. UWB8]|uniref:glycosyltransferase family 2 protein n=1 Tax=Fibrobacter sp. UWB8 TaxID=1896207 RepID=UPI00091D28EC|nr:glycosyltransferase [Fibrobacter sp. UWB8]SHG37432.1 Glycosyltransferase, GT2 family [Fibrobacter sp. UWB8]
MNEKKISIILPVYNGAEYLAESIESVIAQTYANWELIIVNDCSTDNTLAIASDYAAKDGRIKIFSNKENLKLPNTLNAGFRHATGEYYTWTSDDNKYMPDALRVMVGCLEKNPDAVMVYANYTRIDSTGKIVEPVNLSEPKFIFLGDVVGACFLYTAAVAKKIGDYDADLFLAEDYDYWIRMHKVGKILHIEANMYHYRIHGKSLTQTRKKQIDEQTYGVLQKNFQFAYTKSLEYGLCYEFFDHMLGRTSEHYQETRNKFLSLNKRYRYHLIWKKIRTYWDGLKVFIWYSRLWQMLLKLKKAL